MTNRNVDLCNGFEICANGKVVAKVNYLKNVFDYFPMPSDMKTDFIREILAFGSATITARMSNALVPTDFKVVAIPCNR